MGGRVGYDIGWSSSCSWYNTLGCTLSKTHTHTHTLAARVSLGSFRGNLVLHSQGMFCQQWGV